MVKNIFNDAKTEKFATTAFTNGINAMADGGPENRLKAITTVGTEMERLKKALQKTVVDAKKNRNISTKK